MRVSTTVKPADILEEIWVRDVVDLTWEVFRLRRVKSDLINASKFEGLEATLSPVIGYDEAHNLAGNWMGGKTRAIKKVDRLLQEGGLSAANVVARGLVANLGIIERIERMIAVAEARRNAALREIDRHRATLADALRRTIRPVEDGRYPVLEGRAVERAAQRDQRT
jgi:hypothetical protein